jgi:uncharacterized phosphosugar-binding protein
MTRRTDTVPPPASDRPALRYLDASREILDRFEKTQLEAVEQAAQLFANAISAGGLVHMFGSGHSRMAVEEMFPRYGSFPGFHPIVELSLTYHNQVVGANGQRQAMFIEGVEGLGDEILRNFEFGPDDVMFIISNSGTNAVVVDVAIGARECGMPVVALLSAAHRQVSAVRHSSGRTLADLSDLVIDNCAPAGDAMVRVPGLEYPVGPGSTIGNTLAINAIKCEVARLLTDAGQPPIVLTHSHFVGGERSRELFEAAYGDYRRRVRRL